MGLQTKSTCQLRLEARSRAYAQQKPQCVEQIQSRIARADELRVSKHVQRMTRAHERVMHAKRVAREQHAKRSEQLTCSRRATREKLEIARQRRHDQLARMQQVCQRRVALVLEKVETVREGQQRREERQRRLLDSQLGDAARRRAEQTEQMVRRLSQRWQSVEHVKDRVQRAKFIQRWYRRHVEARKNAISLQAVKSHVAQLVACWRQIATTGFEESMMLLQQRDLLRAAQSLLRVLLPSASGDASPAKSPTGPRAASVRVLLMAGMLAYHPQEIMESGTCPVLAFAAKLICKEMECIAACLEGGSSHELKRCVSQLEARFAFYFESFSSWKDRDAERLANEMLQSYREIFATKVRYAAAAEQAVEGDGMHELMFHTEKQLVQLKSAIAQVIGKEEALRRIGLMEQAPVGEPVPTQTTNEPSTEQAPTTEETTSSASPIHEQTTVPESRPTLQPPPSQVAGLLSDERLVHELILNPSFKLPQQDEVDEDGSAASLTARVQETMRRAFWDQIVASNDVSSLVTEIDGLRSEFAKAVPMRPDLVQEVDGALQTAILRNLMQYPMENSEAIKVRCERVLQAIARAEAPARSESTRAFLTEFKSKFESISTGQATSNESWTRLLADFIAFSLRKIDMLRVDMMNVHVGMLSAYLSRHGIEYEQKKLNEKLSSAGKQSLAQTERWLSAEMPSYWAGLSSDQRDQLKSKNATAYSRFLRSSMMALVSSHIDGRSTIWPETFALDVDRIRGFRDGMDRITLVACLLAMFQDYAARRHLPLSRELLDRLVTQLNTLLRSASISGSHLVAQVVQEARLLEQARSNDEAMYAQELGAFEERVGHSFDEGNPVFGLFFKRVTAAVTSAVLKDNGEVDIHPSLVLSASELKEIGFSMRKLARHNEATCAAPYNAMVASLVAPLKTE